MIVLVDERTDVSDAYKTSIGREGYSVASFSPPEFIAWFNSLGEPDLNAVDAFVLGDFADRPQITRNLKRRVHVPTIALNDVAALDVTLRLFEAGADDVVRKPVHARELIARIAAIRRRTTVEEDALWSFDGLVIFGGGRSPEVNGREFQIPRRELRILEHLAVNRGRRSTRAQIFASVYGMFDERVEECVVESHISKLRKKLRAELGYDPIDMQRYLGYQLVRRAAAAAA
ncbi:response regulator transcription factor [Aestuariivirga sp.]|uniref:response regulator transcription factor n=1 Tax=Aestuariivirga sp. TaxID=2650926 RepID=UPI0039E21CE7